MVGLKDNGNMLMKVNITNSYYNTYMITTQANRALKINRQLLKFQQTYEFTYCFTPYF